MESDTNFILAFLESMNAVKWGLFGVALVGLELVTGTTYILWPAAAALFRRTLLSSSDHEVR